MTHLRRHLLLITLALTTVLGLTGTAQAAFDDKTTATPVSISTTVVAAPTNPTAQLDSCSNARWIDVTVSWTPSTTAAVSGYVVRTYRSNGQVSTVAQTAGSATSVRTTVDKFAAGTSFTVTTLTSYGWTATSAPTGAITC